MTAPKRRIFPFLSIVFIVLCLKNYIVFKISASGLFLKLSLNFANFSLNILTEKKECIQLLYERMRGLVSVLWCRVGEETKQ